MAKDTLDTIRQVELESEQKIKEATKQSKEFATNAKLQAEKLIASLTNEAVEESKKALEEAKVQGESLVQEASNKAKNEIVLMQELAKQKEEKAIQLILSEII